MKLAWERLDGRSGHIVGRALLAELYQSRTGEAMPPIAVTPQGKPYFPDGKWHFSISHTKNHVFCALSRKNIGIDAEEIGRVIDPKMASRILSPAECEGFDGSADMLLKFWVIKEAYAKLTGRGLGNYLRETDLDTKNVVIIDGCYVAVLEE